MPNWDCDDDSDTCCNGGMICEPTCSRRLESEAREREEQEIRRNKQMPTYLDRSFFDEMNEEIEGMISFNCAGKPRAPYRIKTFAEVVPTSRHQRITNESEKITLKRDSKMKVISARYERVNNLGNYETERAAFEGTLEKGDTPEGVVAELKALVNKTLGIEQLTPAEVERLEQEVKEKKEKLAAARRRAAVR